MVGAGRQGKREGEREREEERRRWSRPKEGRGAFSLERPAAAERRPQRKRSASSSSTRVCFFSLSRAESFGSSSCPVGTERAFVVEALDPSVGLFCGEARGTKRATTTTTKKKKKRGHPSIPTKKAASLLFPSPLTVISLPKSTSSAPSPSLSPRDYKAASPMRARETGNSTVSRHLTAQLQRQKTKKKHSSAPRESASRARPAASRNQARSCCRPAR